MKLGNPKAMTGEQRDEVEELLRLLFEDADLTYDNFEVKFDKKLDRWYYTATLTTSSTDATWWQPAESTGLTYEIRPSGLYFDRYYGVLRWAKMKVTETGGW